MIFDTHIHTEFSGDSEMKLVEAMKRADELGIGMILTEHMDINDYMDRSGFDVPGFFEEYTKYRGDKLLFGIELGLKEEAVERNIELIKKYDFDYVLCSTHAPYSFQEGLEFFDKEIYDGRTKEQAYEWYFQSMIRGIKENEYMDSLAHVDYIARYAAYDNKQLYYSEYKDYIDTVLKELAQREKSMEISTRRIGDEESAKELIKIYKRFKELGGETVTIGSDAHYVGGIAANFKKGLEIAEAADLKPVYYKNRNRIYMKR